MKFSFGIAILAAGILLPCGAARAQDIHLKSRDISVREERRTRPAQAGPRHQIVQFDHPPGTQDLEALMAAGYRVVAAVPDNAVMVLAPEGITAQIPGVSWTGQLETSDKLSSAFAGTALAGTGPVQAIIEFHGDVEAPAQQAVAVAEGLTLRRPAMLLGNHAIVETTPDKLRALAQHDEVAYIFPADPGLEGGDELLPCAGMLTLAGPVGQYSNIVQGWAPDAGSTAHLGYIFGALTPKLSASTIESAIIRALDTWSSVTNVVFSPAASATAARTVLIEFASGAHGDAYPFDSAGQTLAHTFYPVPLNPESIAGDMHLNDAVNWHSGSDVDIYSVALHEIGHALGLGHTDNPGDVMYPYYREGMQLSANDIGAVQALYGKPGAGAGTTSGTTAPVSSKPAAAPLNLSLNAIPSPGEVSEITISGAVSGGTQPVTVSWQTNHGYAGKATASGGTWTATGLMLVTGANTITVSAFDAANKNTSQSAVVTRAAAAPAPGSRPINVSITSPTSAVVSTSSATISLSGNASGGCGVTKVTWQTNGGAIGTATGDGPWVAANIPLLVGTNTILVRAYDSDNESGWASVVVVRN